MAPREIVAMVKARGAMKEWRKAALATCVPQALISDPIDDAQRIFIDAPNVYAVVHPNEQMPPLPRIGTGKRKWEKIGESAGLHVYELQ